jgi:glycosyltransferase involved in cell wall biosynthesis
MKALFISSFKEPSGWGEAGRRYIMALDKAGVEVVPRCVRIRPDLNPAYNPFDRIRELENNSSQGCDVVIQNVLPHLMQFDGNFEKNIALFYTETTNLGRTNWAMKLNLMDECWVAHESSIACCKNSRVTQPVSVVPIPTDLERFESNCKKMEIDVLDDDTFVFYFIGELTPRKNLEALLLAYHTEFHYSENVALTIKTSMNGENEASTTKKARELCNQVRDKIRLYDDPNGFLVDAIITKRLTEEQMWGFHKLGNCFVMPSFGEGWNIPAMDALGFGNPVITTDICGGSLVTEDVGWLVKSHEEPVTYAKAPLIDIYTGRETWNRIDILALRKAMREAFEDRKLLKQKGDAGREHVKQFSYEQIGNKMKDLINV